MTTQNPSSLIKISGTLTALVYVVLMVGSRGYGDASLALAATVYVLAALIVSVLVFKLLQVRPAADQMSQALTWLVFFAVLFRLLGFCTFPVLEDDFYRYLWDGRMVVETWQPYGTAPAQWFDDDALNEAFLDILDGINYPWLVTVYGPTLQLWYGLGYWLAPGEVWPLQLVAGLADIGVLLVLVKLCAGRRSLLLGGCALYAWSPLLIKEFATTAHPDVVGVFFVALALLCYCRERWFLLGFCFGIATGVKPFALVIAPFLIALRWRAMTGFALAVVVLSLPFLAHLVVPQADEQPALTLVAVFNTFGAIWLPEGLRAMGDDWLFNAPMYLLASEWQQALTAAGLPISARGVKTALLVGFSVLWFWQLARWLGREMAVNENATQHTADNRYAWRLERLGELPHAWLFGVFLLVLPALNPWYLVWWLPFAVLRLRGTQWVTPWVASVALGLSYATGINLASESNLGLYEIPGVVVTLEFALIAIAVGWDVVRAQKSRVKRRAV